MVNQKEINAFALPGGPMFLNRGMIEAAKTEGEVAGVMAHEMSHVALRHGTAQATKGQKFQIGSVLGQIAGAIVGGTAGSIISQGTQFGLGAAFLKYGREYESQADILGAQILARAGYDPREMANMFKTIEGEGGSRRTRVAEQPPEPGQPLRRDQSRGAVAARAGQRQHRAVPGRSRRGCAGCRPPTRPSRSRRARPRADAAVEPARRLARRSTCRAAVLAVSDVVAASRSCA